MNSVCMSCSGCTIFNDMCSMNKRKSCSQWRPHSSDPALCSDYAAILVPFSGLGLWTWNISKHALDWMDFSFSNATICYLYIKIILSSTYSKWSICTLFAPLCTLFVPLCSTTSSPEGTSNLHAICNTSEPNFSTYSLHRLFTSLDTRDNIHI